MTPLFINGRYLTQALTGVQRFCREIAACIPQATILTPPGTEGGTPAGNRQGQAWEQLELAPAARSGLLLNLGNTAPLFRRGRQAVVIHDAGVFDTPESYSRAFRLWYRALHFSLARNGTRLLTVSEFSRSRLAHHLRLDPARIGVVAEGGEHIFRNPAETAILAEHGLLPGRYALAVGTQAAHKNLAALQGAASLLEQHGMTLALAGARDASVFRAAGAGAARPLGRVSDAALRALYENALCLVFPSRYEGFGLPPLEAMWCGCPVIAGRAGALPEVLGDAALWFAPDDPTGIATHLATLIAEPALRQRIADAGRARAQHYSWPAAAARLLQLAQDA
ncbi:MAG: glycosyltransferase family 1 protein [Rhodospirillales bacterium]|nr:glycosyltransferase family 1 protein [Rhodospirillales bacterium]